MAWYSPSNATALTAFDVDDDDDDGVADDPYIGNCCCCDVVKDAMG
jgi:hypothetical protein